MNLTRWFISTTALTLPFASTALAQADTDIYLASLSQKRGEFNLEHVRNINDREGYDNQPSFTPDGRSIIYTSNRDGQTDIFRYYLRTNATRQVTQTNPESEYSPTVTPAGDAFSVIRVERDSTQRLWQFNMDGTTPRLVLTDIEAVGYHAWGDDHTLGLFVLPDSSTPLPTLQVADTRSGSAVIVAYNIGRSVHKIPARNAISFTQRTPALWLKEIDLDTHAVRPLVQLMEGNEFYAWLPDGSVLMGQGSKLFRWNGEKDSDWEEVADLASEKIDGISRLAVSPEGDWLAIVAARQ
jgi:WD40 repeat protein